MVYPVLSIVAFILILAWIYWPDKNGISNVTYRKVSWWPRPTKKKHHDTTKNTQE